MKLTSRYVVFASGLIGFFAGILFSLMFSYNRLPFGSESAPNRAVVGKLNVTRSGERLLTLDDALAEKSFDRRAEMLSYVGRQLAAESIDKALATYVALKTGRDRGAYLDGLVEVYSRINGEACLRFLEALPPGLHRNEAIEKALSIIAETDPKKALAEIPVLLKGVDVHNASLRVYDSWAQNDAAGALTWATSQPLGAAKYGGIEQICATWGHYDPNGALQYVMEHADLTEAERSLSLRAIVGTWAHSDPQAAFSWALDYSRKSGSYDSASIAVLNWATFDAPSVATTLSSMLDPELTTSVLPSFAQTWATSDPIAAAAWVSALPSTEAKSAAIVELTRGWSGMDGEGALRWAQNLPLNENARGEAIREAAIHWQRFDSVGLEQFLSAAPLNRAEEIRQLILAGLNRPPTRAHTPKSLVRD